MSNKYATQGACLVLGLRRKAHTYADMLAYGLSTSPWRRVGEYLDRHPELALEKGERRCHGQTLITWRVVRVVKGADS